MTATERTEHLKDLQEIGHKDDMQKVLACYFLWIYPKKENVNGNIGSENRQQTV